MLLINLNFVTLGRSVFHGGKNPTLDYIFGNFRPFFPLYPIFCHRNARQGSPLYKFSIISDSIISDRFVPENVAPGREFKIESIIWIFHYNRFHYNRSRLYSFNVMFILTFERRFWAPLVQQSRLPGPHPNSPWTANLVSKRSPISLHIKWFTQIIPFQTTNRSSPQSTERRWLPPQNSHLSRRRTEQQRRACLSVMRCSAAFVDRLSCLEQGFVQFETWYLRHKPISVAFENTALEL